MNFCTCKKFSIKFLVVEIRNVQRTKSIPSLLYSVSIYPYFPKSFRLCPIRVERTFQISNCLLRLLAFQHLLKVPSCLNCPLKNNVVFSIKSNQFCTDVPKVPKVELDFRGSTWTFPFLSFFDHEVSSLPEFDFL